MTKTIANVRAIRWDNEHLPYCNITLERAELLQILLKNPEDEASWGAVPEYQENGDQELEDCNCGMVDSRFVTVRIPFNLTKEELVPDPAAMGYDSANVVAELGTMAYTQDERRRILIAAVCLLSHTHGTFTLGECVRTAMIWERG